MKTDMPIINSLLDVDFYKFTMGQLVFHRHRDVKVAYGFTCRTKGVHLAREIDLGQLREELGHVRSLRFGTSDLHYLRGTNEYGERMFREDYLTFLRGLRLPKFHIDSTPEGDLVMLFPGRWCEAIYWETIALAIVNELYARSLLRGMGTFARKAVHAEGILRLRQKIAALRDADFTFSDFGTRRRFSGAWQREVVEAVAAELPRQFRGTSNTLLAMQLSVLPMGTSAHELPMVLAAATDDGHDDVVRASHNRVLQEWWQEYGEGLSIALADTFGTDFFLSDFQREQAVAWKGVRQDSGDPIAIGDKVVAFYERHGIDPRGKLLVPSDGLDLEAMLRIADHFRGRIRVSFGWGTNLTNDLGLPALSIVIKAVQANGRGTVKLSDNLAKATGSPADIDRYKRIFGYTGTLTAACRY
ncbi:MAG: nicotinate phosphoribosyltransferase [Candidatus Aenigmarchaeota archaeon]|nr:nicotinate phosphoribosyltransferase [Candidatus Aenigmarchaeota archaeon]